MFYQYSPLDQSLTLLIRVKAGAKHNSIEGINCIKDKNYLKISINAIPEKGKANEAIIRFLAKTWGLKQNQIKIIQGTSSNIKSIRISHLTEDDLKDIVIPAKAGI